MRWSDTFAFPASVTLEFPFIAVMDLVVGQHVGYHDFDLSVGMSLQGGQFW